MCWMRLPRGVSRSSRCSWSFTTASREWESIARGEPSHALNAAGSRIFFASERGEEDSFILTRWPGHDGQALPDLRQLHHGHHGLEHHVRRPWLVRLLQQLPSEHPAELASRRDRRAAAGEGGRGDQTGRQGPGPRLPHRPQRRRRQLLRDVPRQGKARPAPAAASRGCRLEFAAGRQQHREAGRRARVSTCTRRSWTGSRCGTCSSRSSRRRCRIWTRRRITPSSPGSTTLPRSTASSTS